MKTKTLETDLKDVLELNNNSRDFKDFEGLKMRLSYVPERLEEPLQDLEYYTSLFIRDSIPDLFEGYVKTISARKESGSEALDKSKLDRILSNYIDFKKANDFSSNYKYSSSKQDKIIQQSIFLRLEDRKGIPYLSILTQKAGDGVSITPSLAIMNYNYYCDSPDDEDSDCNSHHRLTLGFLANTKTGKLLIIDAPYIRWDNGIACPEYHHLEDVHKILELERVNDIREYMSKFDKDYSKISIKEKEAKCPNNLLAKIEQVLMVKSYNVKSDYIVRKGKMIKKVEVRKMTEEERAKESYEVRDYSDAGNEIDIHLGRNEPFCKPQKYSQGTLYHSNTFHAIKAEDGIEADYKINESILSILMRNLIPDKVVNVHLTSLPW